jgi:UDP-glucose 4-epimerase
VRILISGAGGFIGQYLVRACLGDGHALGVLTTRPAGMRATVPPDVEILAAAEGFTGCGPALRAFDPDAFVHLAWAGIPNYSPPVSKWNLDLAITLIDELIANTDCRRFLGAGTCLEYGRTHGECAESDRVQTTSYIAWAKRTIHEYLEVQAHTESLATYWLRLFYVYGPGQRSDSLLPKLIRDLLDGREPRIRNPFNAQDFVYVADAADAFRRALTTDGAPGVYNVGSGAVTTVLDMCRLAEAELQGDGRISNALARVPVPPDTHCFWGNVAKAAADLSWRAQVGVAEGVRRQVASILQEVRP